MALGEFRNDAAKVTQVVDRQALRSMLQAFENDRQQPNFPGLLVDFDHFSCDLSKRSVAAGWINGLEARADGLWGRVRWTDAGLAAVNGGQYRFLSPVFCKADTESLGGDRMRPLRLDMCALTNQPNMRALWPITNSARALPASCLASKNFPHSSPLTRAQSLVLLNRAQRLAKQRGWDFTRAWDAVRFPDGHAIAVEALP